jgi:hypothetical protein
MLPLIAVVLLLITSTLAAPPLLDFTVHLGEGGRSEQLILFEGDTPANVSNVIACHWFLLFIDKRSFNRSTGHSGILFESWDCSVSMRAHNQAATAVNDTREIGRWEGKDDQLNTEWLSPHRLFTCLRVLLFIFSATGGFYRTYSRCSKYAIYKLQSEWYLAPYEHRNVSAAYTRHSSNKGELSRSKMHT